MKQHMKIVTRNTSLRLRLVLFRYAYYLCCCMPQLPSTGHQSIHCGHLLQCKTLKSNPMYNVIKD